MFEPLSILFGQTFVVEVAVDVVMEPLHTVERVENRHGSERARPISEGNECVIPRKLAQFLLLNPNVLIWRFRSASPGTRVREEENTRLRTLCELVPRLIKLRSRVTVEIGWPFWVESAVGHVYGTQIKSPWLILNDISRRGYPRLAMLTIGSVEYNGSLQY